MQVYDRNCTDCDEAGEEQQAMEMAQNGSMVSSANDNEAQGFGGSCGEWEDSTPLLKTRPVLKLCKFVPC
jgi:hypothetical protein